MFAGGDLLLSDGYRGRPPMPGPGHFRAVERREADVADDGSQGTADIGEDRLAEASSSRQPFDEAPR